MLKNLLVFQYFLTFSISAIDFLANLALNLAPKTHQKSSQEPSKIHKKGIENMMQVGLVFGALLGRFLVDFGAKLGGKLDPSWLQNRSNIDQRTMLKKSLKIASKNVTRKHAGARRPGEGGSL